MKKSLFTLSLVSLLSVVTLSSCVYGKNVDGKDVIVSVNGHNYTADKLLEEYGDTTSGVEAYYNAIYNVLISKNVTVTPAMETYASNEVDSFIKQVKTNATTNKKSYRDELSTELEEKGLNSLDELRQTYILEQQKKNKEESYFNEGIKDWYDDPAGHAGKTTVKDSYIKERSPYHIKHVLVKLANAKSSLYNGVISETEAKKLAGVIQAFSEGKQTFGQIAETQSEDTESAKNFGSLGIMDLETSYVSEFKFGVYAFEAYYNVGTKANDGKRISKVEDVASSLKMPEKISLGSITSTGESINVKSTLLENNTLNEISYSDTQLLSDYADKTVPLNGQTKVPTDDKYGERKGKDLGEHYYPRNILFNSVFNNHRVSLITQEATEGSLSSRWVKYGTASESGKTKYALADEKGNPILVTRAGATDSYEGIHFIVIEQSPFWYNKDLANTKLKDKTNVTYDQYLDYYYSAELPGSDVANDQRYITYINSSSTATYSTKAESLKSSIKSYDKFSQYRLYKELAGQSGVSINEELKAKIEKWIDSKIEQDKNTKIKSNYETWKSFVELLQLQDAQEVKKVPYTTDDGKPFIELYVKED